MPISLIERPGILGYTGDPIYYRFLYNLQPVNARLQVQLLDAAGVVITDVSYPLKSTIVLNALNIYLQDLIRPKTIYKRPTFLTPGAGAQTCEQVTGALIEYKIQWRVVTPAVPSPIYTIETSVFALRGGIGDLTFTGEQSINQYTGGTPSAWLPNGQGWLTWIRQKRFMRPDEWGWLTWLNHDGNDYSVEYQVFYMNGTSASYVRGLQGGAGIRKMWYIPLGVDQAALDPSALGVRHIIIGLKQFSIPVSYAASYRIEIDNRPQYNPLELYYRNSLGGWDHIALTEHEIGFDSERLEAEQNRSVATNGANPYYHSSTRPKWSGHTRYLSREHRQALLDAYMSTECAIRINKAWCPVRMITKSETIYKTDGPLKSLLFEFEASGSFTAYPRQFV